MVIVARIPEVQSWSHASNRCIAMKIAEKPRAAYAQSGPVPGSGGNTSAPGNGIETSRYMFKISQGIKTSSSQNRLLH